LLIADDENGTMVEIELDFWTSIVLMLLHNISTPRSLNSNKPVIVDSNFIPSAVTWQTQQNVCIVFDSSPTAPLCENMTSSTKMKEHNMHCCPRRVEPRPQVTFAENIVKS